MINLPSLSSNNNHIPLRDFFKNPEKLNYQISPDGKYFSYLAPINTRLNIFIQEISSGNTVQITKETERDIRTYFWGNKDIILFLKDNNGDENFHLYGADKSGKSIKDFTPFENVKTQIIDELDEIDAEVLIGLNKRNPEVFDVYRLNIETGELKLEAENPGNIISWLTDHDGVVRIALTSDGVNRSLLYRDDFNEPFTDVLKTNFKETLEPLFFAFDNQFVYAASNLGRDKLAIVKYDIKNTEEIEMLYEHPDVDVDHLHYSKKRKILTAISYFNWKRERVFLDDELKSIFDRLAKDLGEYEISIVDTDKNEERFIVRVFSDRSLGAYYFYDKNKDTLIKLAELSPWLNENELSEMKPVSFKSRDGLTINAYITLPLKSEPKNLSVILLVHGGPWARDTWGFQDEVQFFANRGYAVLQVNYRGSIGYGKKFWQASFKEWGKAMQNDLTDGVQWLISQGIADPKKVAIYGGSYGGYAVLAGLTITPDLYACGVDYVGVSNLFTFMKTFPPYWKAFLEMMYEMVGNPDVDKEMMTTASPVFNVDKIKAPLFIAQGRMDPRVNVDESDQMVNALKARGIDVPYLVKDNEGHGFKNEENRFEFYEQVEKFLEKYLK